MKDWFGKAYDYLVQTLGSLIIRQRWTDYKRWTDFTDNKWITPEILKEVIQYSNPPYRFFNWWLRFANFVGKVFGILKLGKIERISVHYFLQALINLKQTGNCFLRAIYKLQSFNSFKVLGQGLGSLKFWTESVGILKVLGQGLAIIRIPLQILGIEKILGICNTIIRILLQIFGSVKIQGTSCVTQYVSWQHFKTWQEWANATGGKWYFMC